MGNYQGVIGYGYGKGNDMEDAMEYAIRNCKKNLIAIPLDD
jgi:ribosomal protein S5